MANKGEKRGPYIKKAPASLNDIGASHWKDLYKLVLDTKGEVSEIDCKLIEQACMMYTLCVLSQDSIDTDGVNFTTENTKMIKVNPATSTLTTASNRYQSLLSEMLMTSKSVKVEKRVAEANASPLDNFFKNKK